MIWFGLEALFILAFWLWRRGRVRTAVERFVHKMEVRVLSEDPEVKWVGPFLSDGEIERLKRRARPHFRRSKVTRERGREGLCDDIRTSETATLSGFRFFPIVPIIKAKAAHLIDRPVSHIEILQVVRYREGQEYGLHLDGIDFDRFPKERGRGQRTHTVLVYLEEPISGSGTTDFPKLELSVAPERGAAIVFTNSHPDGTADLRTLHAGAPVKGAQVKWALNIWVRDRPLPFYAR